MKRSVKSLFIFIGLTILMPLASAFFFSVTCNLSPVTCLYADFDDTGASARSVSMGNAGCALADDVFGIYYNPAGLGYLRQGQVGADYGRLFVGLTDGSNLGTSFAAIAVPFFTTQMMNSEDAKKKLQYVQDKISMKEKHEKEIILMRMKLGLPVKQQQAFEVGISTAQAVVNKPEAAQQQVKPQEGKTDEDQSQGTDQEEKYFLKHWGTVALGWRTFALDGYYQESAYYLSMGRTYKERLAYGASVKMLSESYTLDDYMKNSVVFGYGSKSSVNAVSVDAGLIYNLMPRLFVGLSASDFNQPDLGLYQTDQLAPTYRMGLAWRDRDIKWAVDGISKNSEFYEAFGLEKWCTQKFALRGGLTLGGNSYFNVACGMGFNFDVFELDYGFSMPLNGITGTVGSHRMNVIYRFGSKPKEDLEPGSLEYYYSNLEDEDADLKRTLADLKAEKKKLEDVLIAEATMRIKERIQAAGSKQPQQQEKTEQSHTQAVVEKRGEVSHLVKDGDTLQTISKKYYKDERFWSKIYEANKDSIGRGGVLKTNQVLIIPPMDYSVSGGGEAKEQSAPQVASLQQTVVVQPQAQVVKVVTVSTSSSTVKSADVTGSKDKAKAVVKLNKKHIVQPGENLRSIAKKYYNDPKRWKEIYKANKDKVVGGQVSPGQELLIP